MKCEDELQWSVVLRLLKSARLRVTKHRKAILRSLLESGRPVSHSEINRDLPDLDRVTLYRTLSAFVRAGIAHQVQGPDGSWRFCAHSMKEKGCPGNHPHFLCTACGTMICLTGHTLERLEVPEGYEVSGKQFVVYGLCAKCASGSSGRDR
ncbi:MAG: transcriptional repressor [Synergistaceae bacterium]|nr:transcriptional repressor [Synergistaceae bacterium]